MDPDERPNVEEILESDWLMDIKNYIKTEEVYEKMEARMHLISNSNISQNKTAKIKTSEWKDLCLNNDSFYL